jgi:hypothetical protein
MAPAKTRRMREPTSSTILGVKKETCGRGRLSRCCVEQGGRKKETHEEVPEPVGGSSGRSAGLRGGSGRKRRNGLGPSAGEQSNDVKAEREEDRCAALVEVGGMPMGARRLYLDEIELSELQKGRLEAFVAVRAVAVPAAVEVEDAEGGEGAG